MRVGEHQWTEHDAGYQYCGQCGLFEWLAEDGSKCSGMQGVAAEAEGWSVAPLSAAPLADLIEQRDRAVAAGDLMAALTLDDQLEDAGVPADDRETCHTCQSWADHAHHPHTGRRITRDEYATHCAARPAIYGPAVITDWSRR